MITPPTIIDLSVIICPLSQSAHAKLHFRGQHKEYCIIPLTTSTKVATIGLKFSALLPLFIYALIILRSSKFINNICIGQYCCFHFDFFYSALFKKMFKNSLMSQELIVVEIVKISLVLIEI
jgi:hypothetical protein